MGFFSWKTQDTNKSIPSRYSEVPTFTVIMTDNVGTTWTEESYDGYGSFGGKDYFELVDQMNGGTGDRLRGIYIKDYCENPIYPSLSESGEYFEGKEPETCEYQGFFYPDECDTPPEKKELSVSIAFGEDLVGALANELNSEVVTKDSADELGSIGTYTFDTQEELAAFVKGVEAASGWLNHAFVEVKNGEVQLT
jgi:hypothetical protein